MKPLTDARCKRVGRILALVGTCALGLAVWNVVDGHAGMAAFDGFMAGVGFCLSYFWFKVVPLIRTTREMAHDVADRITRRPGPA